jgi:hypothetical protein
VSARLQQQPSSRIPIRNPDEQRYNHARGTKMCGVHPAPVSAKQMSLRQESIPRSLWAVAPSREGSQVESCLSFYQENNRNISSAEVDDGWGRRRESWQRAASEAAGRFSHAGGGATHIERLKCSLYSLPKRLIYIEASSCATRYQSASRRERERVSNEALVLRSTPPCFTLHVCHQQVVSDQCCPRRLAF